ncbi:hypothetical protein ACFLQ2_02740 [archaeon]
MKHWALLMVIALVLLGGCVQQAEPAATPTPQATLTPTPVPTTTPTTTPLPTVTPVPTQETFTIIYPVNAPVKQPENMTITDVSIPLTDEEAIQIAVEACQIKKDAAEVNRGQRIIVLESTTHPNLIPMAVINEQEMTIACELIVAD